MGGYTEGRLGTSTAVALGLSNKIIKFLVGYSYSFFNPCDLGRNPINFCIEISAYSGNVAP